VKPGDDIRAYRLVLAPHLHVLADSVATQLVDYVRAGGVLLADCRTGVKDKSNLAYDRTLPGLLAPALGIEINEYESLRLGISDKEEITYKIHAEPQLGGDFTAVHYADWIKPIGAQVMARYEQAHLQHFAAATRNQFGKGMGWYIGTIVNEPRFYDGLVTSLLKDAGIHPLIEPPPGVEVAMRSGGQHELQFLINHAEEETSVKVHSGNRELLTGEATKQTLSLKPFGVAIIELSESETDEPPKIK
jgi:beta-galactosidase